MSSVPVSANSYMFDHGTRPAAMPRVTSAARWNRHASTVSDVPMRAHTSRGRSPDALDAASTRRSSSRGARSPRVPAKRCRRVAGRRADARSRRRDEFALAGRGILRVGDALAAAREVDRVRDEREGVDGDRRPDQEHGDRVEREGSGMTSVYARRIRASRARRPPTAAPRRLLAQRGLECVAVPLRELVDRGAERRVLAAREARRTRAAACGRSGVTLTHMRRRGTNSAASRPEQASTANASTHGGRRRRGGSKRDEPLDGLPS